MKRLFTLLLFIPFLLKAQNTIILPNGTISTTPTFRLLYPTDTANRQLWFNFGTYGYQWFYSGTQIQQKLNSKVKYTDTSSLLSTYLHTGTASGLYKLKSDSTLASGFVSHTALKDSLISRSGIYLTLGETPNVVVTSDGYYNAFPDNEFSNGKIYIVYRKGTQHASVDGKIIMRVSLDTGRTFGSEITIFSTGAVDYRDPSITKLGGGYFILSYFTSTGGVSTTDVANTVKIDSLGNVLTSPSSAGYSSWGACSGKVVHAPNGSWLFPTYGQSGSNMSTDVWTSSNGYSGWTLLSNLTTPSPSSAYAEPNLLVLPNGNILATIRDMTNSQTAIETSTDNGSTWTSTVDKFASRSRAKMALNRTKVIFSYRGASTSGLFSSQTLTSYSNDYGATISPLPALTQTQSGIVEVYTGLVNIGNNAIAMVYCYQVTTSQADVGFRYLTEPISLAPQPTGNFAGISSSGDIFANNNIQLDNTYSAGLIYTTNPGTYPYKIQPGINTSTGGASISLYPNSNATHPGDFWVNISNYTGAKFNIGGFGTDDTGSIFSVGRTGNTVISGTLNSGDFTGRAISGSSFTFTGSTQISYNILTPQGSGGVGRIAISAGIGSSTAGASVNLYAASNATHPGDLWLATSNTAGSNIWFGNDGINNSNSVGYIDRSGNLNMNGSITQSVASGLLKAVSGTLTAAVVGTDYQAAITGTGFVKSASGVISYDANTYLPTITAASTYLPIIANANVSLGSYNLTTTGFLTSDRLTLGATGATQYINTTETNTGTGKVIIQAGNGSAANGAAINLYAAANATHPGDVVLGTSNSTSAYVRFNINGLDGGVDWFTSSAFGGTSIKAVTKSVAAWGTTGTLFNVGNSNVTDNSSSGTVASASFNSFAIPVLVASNATTYTNSSTVSIDGPPNASTNVTITNPWALHVRTGNTNLGGSVAIGSFATGTAGTDAILVNHSGVIGSISATYYALTASPTFTGTPAIAAATGTSLVVSAGLMSTGTYTGSYTDGILIDYTSGLGRFSVGTSDGFAWYNGGIANTSLASLSSSGAFSAASITATGMTAHSVLYAGTAGLLSQDNSNFYYDATAHILHMNTGGDMTGTNTISGYGEVDMYEPQSAIGAVTNATVFPGFTSSTSRGTGTSPLINNTGDYAGGFSGWAYTGSTPAYTYMAGMAISAVGTTSTNLGGQLDFFTKVNGASTTTSALTIFNNQTVSLNGYATAGILHNAVTTGLISSSLIQTADIASSISLTTPTIGVATATSINKVAITAPATSATLTIANGATLQQTGAFTLNNTLTANSTPTYPAGAGTLAYLAGANTWGLSQTVASGNGIVFNNSANTYGSTLAAGTLTANRTLSAPDITGTIVISSNRSINILASDQVTLGSGTIAWAVAGMTATSKAYVTRVTPSGSSLTVEYNAVCTSGTVTITADVAAGTINTADNSTLNVFVTN
jgi:hypothetical protein